MIRMGFSTAPDHPFGSRTIQFAATLEEFNQLQTKTTIATLIVDTDDVVFSLAFLENVAKLVTSQIIVLLDETQTETVKSCVQQSIAGILTKSCSIEELNDCVVAVEKSQRFFCNKILNLILNSGDQEDEDCDPTELTKRELDVLKLLVDGHTNKSAGVALNISQHTVHSHRKNLMKKLKTNTIGELIKEAYRLKLV